MATSIIYRGLEVHAPKEGGSDGGALEVAVLDKLLEANDVDVPQDRVDNELNGMVLAFYQQLRYDSLTTGTPHFQMHEEVDAQMDPMREEAYRAVKTDLLLQTIIEEEKLQVTRGELEEEAEAMSLRQGIPMEQIRDFLGEDLGMLRRDLLIRKAIRLVREAAVFV